VMLGMAAGLYLSQSRRAVPRCQSSQRRATQVDSLNEPIIAQSSTQAVQADISLKDGSNMRDIFDVCRAHGLPSLAQGMIEFPPPQKLREIAARKVLDDGVHTYRGRMGEDDYTSSISSFVQQVYGEDIKSENFLLLLG